MKYRLLMVSPEFTEDTLPAGVRDDVAEACTVMKYETGEELVAGMAAEINTLLHELALKKATRNESAPA